MTRIEHHDHMLKFENSLGISTIILRGYIEMLKKDQF